MEAYQVHKHCTWMTGFLCGDHHSNNYNSATLLCWWKHLLVGKLVNSGQFFHTLTTVKCKIKGFGSKHRFLLFLVQIARVFAKAAVHREKLVKLFTYKSQFFVLIVSVSISISISLTMCQDTSPPSRMRKLVTIRYIFYVITLPHSNCLLLTLFVYLRRKGKVWHLAAYHQAPYKWLLLAYHIFLSRQNVSLFPQIIVFPVIKIMFSSSHNIPKIFINIFFGDKVSQELGLKKNPPCKVFILCKPF